MLAGLEIVFKVLAWAIWGSFSVSLVISLVYMLSNFSICVSFINIFIMGWGDLSQEPRRVEVKLFFPPLHLEKCLSNEEKL